MLGKKNQTIDEMEEGLDEGMVSDDNVIEEEDGKT